MPCSRMNLVQLVKRLPVARDPVKLFQSYKGTDWKYYIQPSFRRDKHPTESTLWRSDNDHMKLVVANWYQNQTREYFTTYAMVHTKILYGCVVSTTPVPNEHLAYSSGMFHCVPPHSIMTLTSIRHSVSLHLIHIVHA